MWTHTVLEIYQAVSDKSDDQILPWPSGGTPADWIDQGLVGYCQGRVEDLVAFIPLWKLLWWKVKGWAPEVKREVPR